MWQNQNVSNRGGRVLIVLKDLRIGNGMAACIMNYYPGLINNGIEADFLLCNQVESSYMEQVKLHSHIYVFPPSRKKWTYERREYTKQLLTEQNYAIVHVNLPGAIGAGILEISKECGIQHRIYHSHNPKNTSSLKAVLSAALYNPRCIGAANSYLACSSLAGHSVFGNRDFTVLKNCIQAKKFTFDQHKRKKIRTMLKIPDNVTVVGSVGRMEEQKNPVFALRCFQEFHKIQPNSCYLWVGTGSMQAQLQEYSRKNGLEQCVYLVGPQNEVQNWYSAMDIFLLPSRFEGLGIVFIEAQASGLVTFGSDAVPVDTEVTGLMHRISLRKSETEWAKQMVACEPAANRQLFQQQIQKSGYDAKYEDAKLAEYYLSQLYQNT